MKYVKPQIDLILLVIDSIQSSMSKDGFVVETCSPHLFVTAPAYEADE